MKYVINCPIFQKCLTSKPIAGNVNQQVQWTNQEMTLRCPLEQGTAKPSSIEEINNTTQQLQAYNNNIILWVKNNLALVGIYGEIYDGIPNYAKLPKNPLTDQNFQKTEQSVLQTNVTPTT